jgi:hypothetical protein
MKEMKLDPMSCWIDDDTAGQSRSEFATRRPRPVTASCT